MCCSVEVEKKLTVKEKLADSQPDKMYTSDPSLLLAFVYFDVNHTGYLLEKDVEDLMHCLGLQLSRAQV